MPAQGTVALADRYALDEVIGRGGMADVYRGRDLVLGRPVAVKVLREETADPARFISEARTLASLNHPGLVTLLDAGTDANRPYLVMELVDGTTLAECCRDRALEPAQVAAIGAQLAGALAYVHDVGIIHRDVKPGNVLLSDDGRVLLTDFGIAKLTAGASDLTATGLTIGTAAYLAPEQIQRRDIGPATDVYSLGLVLLEALTGERAYTGPPAEAAVARLRSEPELPNHLPKQWRALLRRVTAMQPNGRPAMSTVGETLERLATGTDAATAVATAAMAVAAPDTQPMGVPVAGSRSRFAGLGPRLTAGVRSRRGTGAGAESRVKRGRLALGFLMTVLLAVFLFVLVTRGGEGSPATDIPPDLPPPIREDLEDLHRAVNG